MNIKLAQVSGKIEIIDGQCVAGDQVVECPRKKMYYRIILCLMIIALAVGLATILIINDKTKKLEKK